MYNVFIVEDEHLIRDSLRKQLLHLKAELPIQFAGEAADGELALASILDIQPDIILTDIKMPFMDGLTFASEVKKIFPWIRIIFISGFDDFDYAKAAIRVQADEYLLKPIKMDELQSALATTIQSLNEQKKSIRQKEPQSQEFLHELRKNHFLNGLFAGELTMTEIIAETETFQRSLVGKNYVVLLATNHYSNRFEDYFHFSEYLNHLFGSDTEIIFSSISSKYIKFLLFKNNQEDLLEKCYQVAHTLIHELEETNQDHFVVSIGPLVSRVSDISSAFTTTKNLIRIYQPLQTEKIISYEDTLVKGELSPTNPFKLDLDEKIPKLSTEDIPAFMLELQEAANASDERQHLTRFYILTELVSLCQKAEGMTLPQFQYLNDVAYLSKVAANNESYQQTLEELLHFLIDSQRTLPVTKHKNVLTLAVQFIQQNFSDPNISLNMVAEHVSLSPAHFSTIFSQGMGCTFIEYLTDCRIQLAKKLLRETNEKLAAITLEIGYNDPNYFSYLFKRKEQLSPSEYRQQQTK